MISYDYVNLTKESVIFNEKDIYYNKEKFDSGEINLCFITAISGGGKSTIAKKLAENRNVEHYDLDDLVWNKMKFTMDDMKKYGDLFYSFFNGIGKKYWYTENDVKEGKVKPIGDKYEELLINDFIRYCKGYANSHKNKKYVIEGVWLVDFCKPEDFKDYAFYIKGTSLLVSRWRAAKRDSKDAPKGKVLFARIHNFTNFQLLKANYDFEKDLNKFRNYFKNLMKEKEVRESFMDEYVRVSKPWFVKASDGSINACLNVSGYEKPFRARSSMLILKDINNNPKVYFSYSDKDKEYHAPGGGWNENEDPEEAAVREAREEIHVNVKNVKPFGERLEYYEEIRDWVKDHVSNKKDWWYGYYSKIYVGEYDSKFTGKVNKEDEDSEINSGKFYVFDDIKDKIYPEYKSAIEAYLRSYK